MKRFSKVILLLIVLGLAVGGVRWYLNSGKEETTSFQTAQVTRGDLLVTINSTGTVEPEEVIDVGAQVAGQILSFGKDVSGKTIDYGSVITAGSVLARLDDAVYQAQAAQAQAQVQSSKANLQRAEADLEQLKSKLQQAENDWNRAQKLGPSEALSKSSYDAYKSAYESALANLKIGNAAISQAKASVVQASEALKQAQRNLGFCTITSPVKGVIIDRRVNIGQTVVASLNAPSLFLIAKDLTKMQVWVSVNEADIGKIKTGQKVTFTVDAFPDETFQGEVRKIRLNAQMSQNVVTYIVEISTDNSNNRLLPYLSADVQFELERRENVLTIPNAALRWAPSTEQIVPELRSQYSSSDSNQASSGSQNTQAVKASTSSQEKTEEVKNTLTGEGVVWVPEGPYVKPITVRTGQTDGTLTEVEGLNEGTVIITGVKTTTSKTSSSGSSDTVNPFTPKLPRRSGGGGPR